MKSLVKKKVYILSIIIVAIVCIITFIFFNNDRPNDLSEIQSNINKVNVEFKSKRSFGNDRFDVYSFSLKTPEKIKEFKEIDDVFGESYKKFINMVDIEITNKSSNVESLKKDIEKMKRAADLKYIYSDSKGTEKLYIYSKIVNKGYCLILTI